MSSDDSFDETFGKPHLTFSKLTETLAHIETIIQDLDIRNELSRNNVHHIMRLTRPLYNDELPMQDKIRIAGDLKNAIEQILSYSDIGDQLLSKANQLIRQYPEEFHNVTFDFTNFKAFKFVAMTDAQFALSAIRKKGVNTKSVSDLLELRIIQYQLYDYSSKVSNMISEEIYREGRKNDPNNLTRERFDELSKDLEEARQSASKYSQKYKDAKRKLQEKDSEIESLQYKIGSIREEYEDRIKMMRMNMENKDKEITNLRQTAHEHVLKQREIVSLRAQLVTEKEKYSALYAKYQVYSKPK